MTLSTCCRPFVPIALLLLLAGTARAEEQHMSDKADSLDFEKFHSSTEQSKPLIDLGLGGEKRVDGVNVFDKELDNPNGKGSVQTDDLGAVPSADPVRGSRFNRSPGPPSAGGEAMNIRVRYTLTKSEYTPFLAYTAVHALHSYIVDHCPHGWLKLAEWSLPIGGDHYLYYQFRCAER